MHNPVPFDFVPFSNAAPKTLTDGEWEAKGNLVSGHILYSMDILTPIHIVGKQTRQGNQNNYKITQSFFNRSGGRPVIPGSSIKGMIRSFFEALTNSWVSQATDKYPKVYEEHHLGFAAYGGPEPKKIRYGPMIPERFHPAARDGKIDLASFLFGIVIEDKDEKEEKELAYPSRMMFEDIPLASDILNENSMRLPDIPGKAFMGGPKPKINTWWYFEPLGIAERQAKGHRTTDFIGEHYRGRKFYFHQNPEKTMSWYGNRNNWPHQTRKRGRMVSSYYTYPVETVPRGAPGHGRICFERVPKPLLELFILCLQPGTRIKHKIGYGRAFGLGSVGISVKEVTVFASDTILQEPSPFDFKSVADAGFVKGNDYVGYVDTGALQWLARILSFDELLKRQDYVLTYPPFTDRYFKTPVPMNKVRDVQRRQGDYTTESIAEGLFDFKKTIHFRVYQEKTNLWRAIAARKP